MSVPGVAGSRRLVVSASGCKDSATVSISIDSILLSASACNRAQILPASLSLFGSALTFSDFSAMSRMGHSASASTLWVSETSVTCLISSHLRGTCRAVVTAVEQAGTATNVFSSDTSIVQIATHNNNRATTGSTSVIVRGAGYGPIAFTIVMRVGATGCEATQWESDTEVYCMVTQGIRSSQQLSITGGILSSSTSSIFSFEGAVASSLLPSNAQATGSVFVTIMSIALGVTANSEGVRAGLSVSESTTWMSTSSVACRKSSGFQSSKRLHITVAPHCGSVTHAISYNTASISAYTPTSPSLARICTLSLYGASFSLQDTSGQVRAGFTTAEMTFWMAGTMCFTFLICDVFHTIVMCVGQSPRDFARW